MYKQMNKLYFTKPKAIKTSREEEIRHNKFKRTKRTSDERMKEPVEKLYRQKLSFRAEKKSHE